MKQAIIQLTKASSPIIIGLAMMLGLLIANPVYGQVFDDVCQGDAASSSFCESSGGDTNPVLNVIRTTVIIMTVIIGITSVIMITVSAAQFAASGGGEAAAVARRRIVNAMIGLVLSIFAGTIVTILIDSGGT